MFHPMFHASVDMVFHERMYGLNKMTTQPQVKYFTMIATLLTICFKLTLIVLNSP